MKQLFYYPFRSLHSTYTTFYILPYAQLTNWYDKNRVCFTTYIFSLHSKILQQKSAGSCDKKKKTNLHVLRDVSFFELQLQIGKVARSWQKNMAMPIAMPRIYGRESVTIKPFDQSNEKTSTIPLPFQPGIFHNITQKHTFKEGSERSL